MVMKRTFIIIVLATWASFMAAQDVTKFLGIPVDGYKLEMISKLKAKGFVYHQEYDLFEGEFNGQDVTLSIATNNNKVWRIMLMDKVASNETDIRIRFNNLCDQFERNKRYIVGIKGQYHIPENEDISYEMMVNNKRYEAAYHQAPDTTICFPKNLRDIVVKETKEKGEDVTGQDINELVERKKTELYLENMWKNSVWFMIDEKYGDYKIIMFYDNEYNHADGEDL